MGCAKTLASEDRMTIAVLRARKMSERCIVAQVVLSKTSFNNVIVALLSQTNFMRIAVQFQKCAQRKKEHFIVTLQINIQQ